MGKKNGGFISEEDINSLIRYAEDENSNTPPEEDDFFPPPDETTDREDSSPPEAETQEEDYIPPPVEQEEDTSSYEEEETLPIEEIPDIPEEELFDDGYDDTKKKSKAGVIICVAAVVAAVIVFFSVDSGIIGTYKSNFITNISKLFPSGGEQQLPEATPVPEEKYKSEISSDTIVSFEGANETEFELYKNGIVCAKMNYMSFIDESGAVVWETNTAIVDPILQAEGDYILLAERGRNKICLYEDKNLVYDVDDPDTILSAALSENGDAVVVTNKSSYKGGISVYNKSGAQIFSWSSGSDMVMCTDISASSRRVAVALLNTDQSAKTVIQLFDVNEKESYYRTDLDGTVVFDVRFTDDILCAFGDNRLTGISEKGKIVYDNTFGESQLTHSAFDSRGNVLLSLDDGNTPMLNMYGRKGDLEENDILAGVADLIDINNKEIIYSIGRDIYFGKINSKNMTKHTAGMDIRKIIIISDDTFVAVYSNSLEVVTV